VRVRSDNSYTTVVRAGGKEQLLSKPIREFEAALDEEQFVRVHNSHIINMDHLLRFDKREGGFVVMSDGSTVPVSRRRHQLLADLLDRYYTLQPAGTPLRTTEFKPGQTDLRFPRRAVAKWSRFGTR